MGGSRPAHGVVKMHPWVAAVMTRTAYRRCVCSCGPWRTHADAASKLCLLASVPGAIWAMTAAKAAFTSTAGGQLQVHQHQEIRHSSGSVLQTQSTHSRSA